MRIDEMNIEEMNIEELKAYKASVEVYGTAAELYEVTNIIMRKEAQEKMDTDDRHNN